MIRARLLVWASAAMVFVSTAFGQSFTEEAQTRGISLFTYGSAYWGFGVGLDDLDGDGDVDLIATGGLLGQVVVYENDGTGYFIDRTAGSGLPALPQLSGISLADYDGDGDLDVYITAKDQANVLMRNGGGFAFQNATALAQVGDTGAGMGSSWGDYDGDGFVDLHVANYTIGSGVPNRLYHNLGNGTFEEVAALAGTDNDQTSYQALFIDPDRDGDVDLYLSNDKGYSVPEHHNVLWENVDGALSDISAVCGAGVSIDSMGVDMGDLNADGLFDIYCANDDGLNMLLLGQSGLTFVESSMVAGVRGGGTSWGALFLDFDNDGYQELYTCASNAPNHLYDCDGTFPCQDVAAAYGIDDTAFSPGTSSSFCCATADVDGDGDLDLLVQSANEPLALYINHEGDTRNWLRVKLNGMAPNTGAIGASIRLSTGPTQQWRQVRAGTSYKSSSELVQSFGLDLATEVDEVLVQWPDGTLSVIGPLAINQTVVIDQASLPTWDDCNRDLVPDVDEIAANPALDVDMDGTLDSCQGAVFFRRGDANGDGGFDISDAISVLSYLFAGGSVGCQRACDVGNDGTIDIADAVALLTYIFSGGLPPAAPWPDCGSALSPLPCAGQPSCAP